VIDLPIEIENIEECGLTNPPNEIQDTIINSSDAAQLSLLGKESSTVALYRFIDKKIKNAASVGENCVEISSKDKIIAKEAKVIKKIYIKLKGLGFNCDDGLKKDADGKIMFDKVDTLKIRW